MHIALLDKEAGQIDLITEVLSALGHLCQHFQAVDSLLAHLRRDDASMLLIDWQASAGHGAELIKTARRELSPAMPILFFTHSGSEDEIVAAMAAGANDYMIKPLRRGELRTRVKALFKRAYPQLTKPERMQFGQFQFEPETGHLTRADVPIELTHKEFSLALLFFRHLGRPLSRAYIAEAVWPQDAELPSRTIDTHVSRVRSKLGLRPENGFRLAPVYSYGYRLEQLSPGKVVSNA